MSSPSPYFPENRLVPDAFDLRGLRLVALETSAEVLPVTYTFKVYCECSQDCVGGPYRNFRCAVLSMVTAPLIAGV
jgi:hypothetical protein